ncbi:MAG TPA: cell division protein FtsX [Thiolapillus brandeum]|uniref:Cell division protein FtsX n=1 Tax=Thiolapillus brandeum TaxID=1076588 RepID=A0A831RUT1_9GAMM|nr:cell division protein FtsX [Thiolapillus brandeum]
MKQRRQRRGFDKRFSLSAWLTRHAQVLFSSLGRLWQRPLGSLMTLLVLGIAIALPLGLHLLVNNLQQLAEQWDSGASVSVFLKENSSDEAIQSLIGTLKSRDSISGVRHITPDQALEEFRQQSDFSAALELLDDNPLPHVLQIRLRNTDISAGELEQFLQSLEKHSEVELALADLQWVERFQAITRIIQRIALVLAVLLSLAVLLIIGNTIRLEIQGRRDEIEIIKLVGGSNAFIRRPFLYEGFWYGLMGSLIALGLILLSGLALRDPVTHLTALYQSSFQLSGLALTTILGVIGSSVLLGILGAWIAVSQHLGEMEPD